MPCIPHDIYRSEEKQLRGYHLNITCKWEASMHRLCSALIARPSVARGTCAPRERLLYSTYWQVVCMKYLLFHSFYMVFISHFSVVRPKACPAVDVDLGCGGRLQTSGPSSPGTTLDVSCACPGTRSAIGPRLHCLDNGEWSADLTGTICRRKVSQCAQLDNRVTLADLLFMNLTAYPEGVSLF